MAGASYMSHRLRTVVPVPKEHHVDLEQLRRDAREDARRAADEGQALASRMSNEAATVWRSAETWLVQSLDRSPLTPSAAVLAPVLPAFHPGELAEPLAPPPRPSLTTRLAGRDQTYRRELEEHRAREAARIEALASAERAHQGQVARSIDDMTARNNSLEAWHSGYLNGDTTSIERWLSSCLDCEPAFGGGRLAVAVAYVADSRHLVVEMEAPSLDSLPESCSYRYVKTTGEIVPQSKPAAQRRSLYSSLLAQSALQTLHAVLVNDVEQHVETVSLNLVVNGVDRRTGAPVRPCLLSVRTTRERFAALRLDQVDPVQCLQGLNASVSRSPAELVAVAPVTRLEMNDRRFVTEEEILSTLDQRPNLLALTPSEFESLITNLFSRMGLETKLTQASRDGGVDCVAFDMRPVLGGKVVIQAKRYSDTVGVSAVRDLYGTVLNEGAGKGILVTTSGYGPAAFEFASNKPLELLSGANLLSLLSEWAGVEAKIEPVESQVSA